MDRIITNDVWNQIVQLIGTHTKKLAAIAYVSKGTPLSFEKGDSLVCDASDQAIKSGETDAKTLKAFFKAGVTLGCCPGLHAKLLVSGNWAVIGSANLSASSGNHLIEASLVTTRTQIRSQARALIHNLLKTSSPIDEQFITHICSLSVTRRPRAIHVSKKRAVKEVGNRYWIVNTQLLRSFPADEEEYVKQGEEEARSLLEEDNDIAWIRWIGKSRFREQAKPGDTLIEILRHRIKSEVFQPRPLLLRQEHKKWTRFYLENPADLRAMSWTEFEGHLKRVGLQKIKKGSTRELTAQETTLMESIWQTG